jgi:hypothetical protein
VLAELEERGWIAETSPADPAHAKRRRWRLTRHPANGKTRTKEFMRWTPEKLFHGNQDGTDTAVCVTGMGPSDPEPTRILAPFTPRSYRNMNDANKMNPRVDGPATVTQNVPSSPTRVTHIENHPFQTHAGTPAPSPVIPLGSARAATARRARAPSTGRGG